MDLSAILIVRTSALGDVVHALPVLTALGKRFPQSRIGWVVEDLFAPLVADHPHLDTVIPVRLRGWRRSWHVRSTRTEARAAWRQLRSFGATVALDLMGNHKGAFLSRLSGAAIRVGAAPHDRREAGSGWWINRPQPLVGEHAVDRGLSLLRALEIEDEPADFLGAHCIPQLDEAAAALRRRSPTPYILIQPGAGWANKCWPAESWGQVAAGLADDGHHVLILAGPGEETLAETVVTSSGGRAEVANGPGMPYLAGVLRGARLLLGGDTGPLHLAHALGVPVLAVMGPTDPARHGPYQAPERSLVHRLPCSFCSRRLPETKACLALISPSTVLARARALLAASNQ